MASMQLKASATEKAPSPKEQQAKICEVRKIVGPITDKFPALFSDASILRFLRARNWSTKKTAKTMKDTLKWRLEYKPDKIQWDDVSQEAKTGRVYRADILDKQGRIVLVMRAGVQSIGSPNEQIKFLVYCLENAILNLNSNQEHMVWLIDFQGWSRSSLSLKVTRDAIQLLQNYYPERLGLAILYNPPKIFESFWTMVKPFIEPRTHKKVKFVYPDNPKIRMIMEEFFDMEKLDTRFGGKGSVGFNYGAFALKMREDDKKMSSFADFGCPSPSVLQSVMAESQQAESSAFENGCEDESSCDEVDCSNVKNDGEILQGQASSLQDDTKNKVNGAKNA